MNDNSNLVVNGYCFGTAEDAELARQEVKKIEYLEQHMDYGKPENILLVYQKAIGSKVFRTPVGWEYLRGLRKRLQEHEEMKEQLTPITLYTVFGHRIGEEAKTRTPRTQQKKKNSLKGKLVISVFINLLLTVAVGGMLAIALTSGQPNVLNYERALVNKYAAWEQELTEKENKLREMEREMTDAN